LAESIKGKEVEVSVKAGSKDRIYGSVTSGDIAAALKDLVGFEVDRKRIDLKKPIHELGTFEVTVRLSSQLTPKITVIVTGE
jgi:large subunit ribosomal protein L9